MHRMEKGHRQVQLRFDQVIGLVQGVIGQKQAVRFETGSEIEFFFQQSGNAVPAMMIERFNRIVIDAVQNDAGGMKTAQPPRATSW